MIEVLKKMVDVLEYWDVHGKLHQPTEEAIQAGKQAIAELESQEPVAHQKWCASLTQLLLSMPPQPAPCNCHPQQRTWVGLTDEELADCLDMSIQKTCRAIEVKLKDKNT